MSRIERHSRSSRTRQSDKAGEMTIIAAAGDDSPQQLPPRRKKFPSSRYKANKWYFHILFALFLSLVAFLFWYGNKFSS